MKIQVQICWVGQSTRWGMAGTSSSGSKLDTLWWYTLLHRDEKTRKLQRASSRDARTAFLPLVRIHPFSYSRQHQLANVQTIYTGTNLVITVYHVSNPIICVLTFCSVSWSVMHDLHYKVSPLLKTFFYFCSFWHLSSIKYTTKANKAKKQ